MACGNVMELKKKTKDAIEQSANDLHQLSDGIWSNPELCFQETKAHNLLCSFLENRGFNVTRNYKLDTAFRAEIGDKAHGPNIAVLCEYDALPEIGHSCGHNLISETGAAAAIGIKAAFESLGDGKQLGKLTVLGTPAEEGGGGKILLLEAGAFDSVDVALIAHPKHRDNAEVKYLASNWMTVVYTGKAAHASVSPWDGRNALDAAVLAYQNISCLRQQMKPTWRIHGVITKGGTQPNIIPEETELQFQARAPSRAELSTLTEKARHCFEAAAAATGCEIKFLKPNHPDYLNVVNNKALERTYRQNGEELGISFVPVDSAGSTDMGNVSFKLPAIHPAFSIGTESRIHTREFGKRAGSAEAQPFALRQGEVLAGTALDIYTNEELLREIQDGFREDMLHN